MADGVQRRGEGGDTRVVGATRPANAATRPVRVPPSPGQRGLARSLRQFFVMSLAQFVLLLLFVTVTQLTAPLDAAATQAQTVALRLYALVWAALVLLALAITWTRAHAPSGLVSALQLVALGFAWILLRAPLLVALPWLLAFLVGLLVISAALSVERRALREDRRETRRLVRAHESEQLPQAALNFEVLYGDATGELVAQQLRLWLGEVWFVARVTLPDASWAYAELPLSAIRQIQVDEARGLVRLALGQPLCLELHNRGTRAFNDPAPRYSSAFTRRFATDRDWQAYVGSLEARTGLSATRFSSGQQHYVLRREGRKHYWYGQTGAATRQGPRRLRAFRDEAEARARLAQLLPAPAGVVLEVVALDPDLPLLDDPRQRSDQGAWLSLVISLTAVAVMLLPDMPPALVAFVLAALAPLAATEATRQLRRGRHPWLGLVTALPALLAIGIWVALGLG